MVLISEGFFEVATERVIWTHDHWIPFRRSNQLSYQAMSYYQATCIQSQFCIITPISSFVQCQVLFWLLPSLVATFTLIKIFLRQSYECSGMNWGKNIHHWKILWRSYKKLVWVEFQPTTTEFRSDTLTNWAIRPRVQLALRASFAQLLQFHCLLSVRFHFAYCLHQSQSLF